MRSETTDLSTILGIIAAFGLVGAAIYLGGSPRAFFNIPSVLIVFLGTYMITMACFSLPEMLHSQGLLFRTIFYSSEDLSETAKRSIEVAELSRKEGLLGMEKHIHLTRHNHFLKKGLTMLIDGVKGDKVREILEYDLGAMLERHANGIAVLRKAGEIAPAMGLIGTLIGLVQMLGNLEDPSTIGPAMAVALLTTFYGAMLAYVFFLPLATKLERNTKEEVLVTRLYMAAIDAIAEKENPRNLELMLNSILPSAKRTHYFD